MVFTRRDFVGKQNTKINKNKDDSWDLRTVSWTMVIISFMLVEEAENIIIQCLKNRLCHCDI